MANTDLANRDEKGRFGEGNQISVGGTGGRPPTYSDPADMIKRADEYFVYIMGVAEEVDEEIVLRDRKGNATGTTTQKVLKWIRRPEPPTITGISLFLGFCSRSSLYEYEYKYPDFTDTIKAIRTRVEYEYEKGLWGQSATGAIFALKNMGWQDKSVVETDAYKPPPEPVFQVANTGKKVARSEAEAEEREKRIEAAKDILS